jgi:hypothetical protein
LRACAQAAEMSPRTLLEYLQGGAPAPPRTRSLGLRLATKHGRSPDTHDSIFERLRVTAGRFPAAATVCASVLETVISPLPPRVHGLASADFMDVLIRAYHRAEGGAPPWLTTLRADLEAYLQHALASSAVDANGANSDEMMR